ncbi:MAG: flagellar biosynthetic protein FliR [bacterium]|nr:flagellar biosynthetic protein FliR [bacterium]
MNTTFFDLKIAEFQIFLLLFVRMIGILAVAPIFGHRTVISQTKVGFALVLAIVLYPVVPVTLALTPDLMPYFFVAVKELILGMIFGFVSRLTFVAVQFAGEVIGIDIGFGVVNIIDPMSGGQVSVIGTFKNLIALVTFLIIDGHHIILLAMTKSFEMVPLGGIQLTEMLARGLISMSAGVFAMAIQMAAPIITALFLTSLALGIMARTVPQMNVFVVGFPLKIGIGMAMLAISLPLFQTVLIKFFGQLAPNLSILLQQMYRP